MPDRKIELADICGMTVTGVELNYCTFRGHGTDIRLTGVKVGETPVDEVLVCDIETAGIYDTLVKENSVKKTTVKKKPTIAELTAENEELRRRLEKYEPTTQDCPFCGCRPFDELNGLMYFIGCPSCGTCGPKNGSLKTATEMWNTMHSDREDY